MLVTIPTPAAAAEAAAAAANANHRGYRFETAVADLEERDYRVLGVVGGVQAKSSSC